MSRPEYRGPPEIIYGADEARKYAHNTRMIEIQNQMARRALELLELPKRPCHILDVGCGSGLSGEVLSEAGHLWTGVDIAPAMLAVALQREVEGDLVCSDIGHGLMFRPGTFDGAISISVLQWLCNADRKEHVPRRRLRAFFQSLRACLVRDGRAVFQLYPDSPAQMELISSAAMACGFGAAIVIDNPDSTRARKVYLCLFSGRSKDPLRYVRGKNDAEARAGGEEEEDAMDQAEDKNQMADDAEEEEEEEEEGEEEGGEGAPESAPREEPQTVLFSVGSHVSAKRNSRKREKAAFKSRDWIQQKKERRRRLGLRTALDSRYSGRRRKPKAV